MKTCQNDVSRVQNTVKHSMYSRKVRICVAGENSRIPPEDFISHKYVTKGQIHLVLKVEGTVQE